MIRWTFEKLLVELEHMFDNDHSGDPVEDNSENDVADDVGDVNDVEHIHRLR